MFGYVRYQMGCTENPPLREYSTEGVQGEFICWHCPFSCSPLGNVLLLTPLDDLASGGLWGS